MATNPNGGYINQGLTDYAFAIFQDFKTIMADAEFIAPRVVTGASVGNYAKFDEKQAFLKYTTRRAIGGERTRIKFAGSNATFSCTPLGLEIGLDDQEANLAGGKRDMIEKAKVRTLLSDFALSQFSDVWTIATTSGNYTAGAAGSGTWSNANIDPIKKIDDEILAFYNRTGMMPNRGVIDLASWVKLRNHPEVIKRQPGSANIGITLAQLSAMLAIPMEFRIVSAVVDSSGFGDATSSKAAVAANKCAIFYASPGASVYDPSALKVFTPTAESFESVKQYRAENIASDIFYLDGAQVITPVSALLFTLITVS